MTRRMRDVHRSYEWKDDREDSRDDAKRWYVRMDDKRDFAVWVFLYEIIIVMNESNERIDERVR